MLAQQSSVEPMNTGGDENPVHTTHVHGPGMQAVNMGVWITPAVFQGHEHGWCEPSTRVQRLC